MEHPIVSYATIQVRKQKWPSHGCLPSQDAYRLLVHDFAALPYAVVWESVP